MSSRRLLDRATGIGEDEGGAADHLVGDEPALVAEILEALLDGRRIGEGEISMLTQEGEPAVEREARLCGICGAPRRLVGPSGSRSAN